MGYTELCARLLRDRMCLTLETIHFLEGKLRLWKPRIKRSTLSPSGSQAGLLPPESARLKRHHKATQRGTEAWSNRPQPPACADLISGGGNQVDRISTKTTKSTE